MAASKTAALLPSCNNNRLVTEREGLIEEYWPQVVAVRTERSEVRTATTKGQYSPVRLEQARLVSCLLYGTRLLIVKCTSSGLHLKGFRRDVFLMTRATQSKASYHEFENRLKLAKSKLQKRFVTESDKSNCWFKIRERFSVNTFLITKYGSSPCQVKV